MAWTSRIRALFRRNKLDRDHDDELQFHLAMREQWNVQHGMAPDEADRDARVRLGNASLWRERMREADVMILPQTILQDVRYGLRMLLRNPGFTAVAIFAMAIGIGVNTAAFTAYKAVIARSLDAREPARLVNFGMLRKNGEMDALFSYPDYLVYRDHLASFNGLIAHRHEDLTLSGVGSVDSQHDSNANSLAGRLGLLPHGSSNVEQALTILVSENYFTVLGVSPLLGRTFTADDVASLAAAPAVLISENYWQRRFARDPAILGKTVRLNGAAFTIIGVTPHNFVGTSIDVPDFWVPLSLVPLLHPGTNSLRDREDACCRIFGRLAPGVTIAQAQAEMELEAGHLQLLHDPHSDAFKPAKAQLWPGSPFPRQLNSGLKFSIFLIMVAVAMVLVVACANVASLQLARAASRYNELSMRLSLGASRFRLIRQLLTESALLGLISGAVALLFTWIFLKAAVTLAAGSLPPEYGTLFFNVTPDLGIFAYVLSISLVAGLLFGLAPALESSQNALSSSLKANGGTSPGRTSRLRSLLIAAQVSVSLVLLITGSLLIRSSVRALKMETGYDTEHIIDVEVSLPNGSSYTAAHKIALFQDLRSRLAALPGITAITSSRPPDGDGSRSAAVSIDANQPSPRNTRAVLYFTYVQPNYFQMLGIPLLIGHVFAATSGPPEAVAVLSQSAATRLWPGMNPIGRTLHLNSDGSFHNRNEALPDGLAYRVIGVVRDVLGMELDNSDSQQIYIPLPADHIPDHPILLRVDTDPTQYMDAIDRVVSSVDPSLDANVWTLEQLRHQTPPVIISSLCAAIASTIGLVGLLLATLGIYGTISYIVVLRTREVGIRMALGARRGDVLALMLRESLRPVLAGLLAGMALALGASHLLSGVLYGVSIADGVSFIGVSLLFLAIALLAAYIPSRSAMSVEPVTALRCE